MDVYKAAEVHLNTDANFQEENNTTVSRKIKRRLKISREVSRGVYELLKEVFRQHGRRDVESIVIKTYMYVQQSGFSPGDRIPLLPQDMFQKVELWLENGNKKKKKLKQILKSFPLNPHNIETI